MKKTKTFFKQLLNFHTEWGVSAVHYEQASLIVKITSSKVHIYIAL